MTTLNNITKQLKPKTSFRTFDDQEMFWELFGKVRQFVIQQLGNGPLTRSTIACILEDAIMEFGLLTNKEQVYINNLNPFAIKWIKDYSLALSMRTLGVIRSKFNKAENGEKLIDMGTKELARLRANLAGNRSKYA